MPGLIDAHVHVFAVKLNQAANGEHAADADDGMATQRIKAMLDRGFTTVRDVAGADYGIRDAIAQGFIPGPRLFISGQAITQTGGHGDQRLRPTSSQPAAVRVRCIDSCRIADGRTTCAEPCATKCARAPTRSSCSCPAAWARRMIRSNRVQYPSRRSAAAVDEADGLEHLRHARTRTLALDDPCRRGGVRCIEHGKPGRRTTQPS